MDRNIKRILVVTAILLLTALSLSYVNAVTIQETTSTSDKYDTIEKGSYIIGTTKFTPDTVITGAMAAQAGANDMKLYIAKNGTAEGYEYPKVLYFSNFGKWKEYTASGELKDANLKTTSFEIFFVDNKEKTGKDTVTNKEIELPTIEKNEFAYSFMNDTTVVKVGTALEGEEVVVPAAPTKDHYTFKGWYKTKDGVLGDKVNPGAEITITEDTVIVAVWELNKYTVSFADEDGETVLWSHEFDYGTDLAYVLYGELWDEWTEFEWNIPEKEGTEDYDYEWIWDDEFGIVEGDKVYTLVYYKVCYIQFIDDDGTYLSSEYVMYGEMPRYAEDPEEYGRPPMKYDTMEHTYEFAGWDHEVVPATTHAIYTAVYTEEDILYTVKFNNYDGNELESKQLTFNAEITYTGEEPTQEMDENYIYVFSGWDPTIENTTVSYNNMIFTAQYTQIPRVYDVDLSAVIPTKSATFSETYYNKYNTTYSTADGEEIDGETATFDEEIFDDDVFYVEIGDYPLDAVPATISINDSVYGANEIKNISIGYNSFLYAPVYKVEDGKLYIALTWLIAESLPGNNNVIILGDLTYNVQTFAIPVDENDVLRIDEVITSNRATNTVVIEGNTIIQNTDNSHDLICIMLAKGDEQLNNVGDKFYRLSADGNMGFTLTETVGGTYKKVINGGTVSNPVITYGTYLRYSSLPANTITRNYKIASAEYGAINVVFKMIGTQEEEQYAGTEAALRGLIANEAVDTIVLTTNIELENVVVIPEGRDITIDLNGFTLSGTRTLASEGTLTIIDSSENESGLVFNNVDLSAVIPAKSTTFSETYYNKYNTTYSTADGEEIDGETATFDEEIFDDDVFYVEIGDYPLDAVPATISINDSVYGANEIKNISIGYNSFLYAPVYKVENGKLYVALTWLIAESLPGNNNTVTLGSFVYNVQVFATPANENDVLRIDEVITSNRANNIVTIEGNTITQNTDNSHDLICVLLAKGEEQLNHVGDKFYRLSADGNMGFTLTETVGGTYKKVINGGTVSNPVITYGTYLRYSSLPANTITRNYKIASAEYGAINITFVMVGTNEQQ